jgi:hypothetical protein
MVVAGTLTAASCTRGDGVTEDLGGTTVASSPVDAAANSGTLTSQRAGELDTAARQVIGFLRGETGFDRIQVADTVTLYLSPEGGGTRAKVLREALRDRANWRVRGLGRAEYSLVPPSGMSKLTTRVGRHFKCLEYPLASRFAELGELPHVGTKLEPADGSSCLQTWNLTLVFDPNEQLPTLVGAAYDQWEW